MAQVNEKGLTSTDPYSGYRESDIRPASPEAIGDEPLKQKHDDASFEVFQETTEGVNFRTVSWQWATVLFLKRMFPNETRFIKIF